MNSYELIQGWTDTHQPYTEIVKGKLDTYMYMCIHEPLEIAFFGNQNWIISNINLNSFQKMQHTHILILQEEYTHVRVQHSCVYVPKLSLSYPFS